jgi:hypothetical protein
MERDPTWVSDNRICEIKHGDDATREEVLALAGKVRERRRELQPDNPLVVE